MAQGLGITRISLLRVAQQEVIGGVGREGENWLGEGEAGGGGGMNSLDWGCGKWGGGSVFELEMNAHQGRCSASSGNVEWDHQWDAVLCCKTCKMLNV